MAENDKDNDEYQFADLDALGPDSDNAVNTTEGEEPSTGKPSPDEARAKLIKNAIIAVVVIIVLIIIVKLFGAFFSARKPETKLASVPQEQVKPAVAIMPPQPPAPIEKPNQDSVKIAQQLTDLESNQQNMQNAISTLNSQLGGINGNLNAISAKMAELSTTIANLSAKVDEQSREIDQLTIKRTKAINAVHRMRHKPGMTIKYYIQAVIPGRAWLIATNGNTLTVREGSIVPGYGVIKLIDPNQGCILTSSGRMIKFSQQDS